MKLDSSPRFNRDLRRIRDVNIRRGIERTIAQLEAASHLTELRNIRKVRSASGRDYRVRIGDYRLGITVEGDVVILVRFLKRGEFYRHFP